MPSLASAQPILPGLARGYRATEVAMKQGQTSMNIYLEGERGDRMQQQSDPGNLLLRCVAEADQPLRLLQYVDPHGITVFNYLQMDDLIADLDDLAWHTQDRDRLAVLSGARMFTNEVKAQRHRYIRFVGGHLP